MTVTETVAAQGLRWKRQPKPLCETPTCNALASLFRLCQAEGEMGIVTGEPGVGKTSAAKLYAAITPCAFMVTMSPASSAIVPCLERIGAAIDAYPAATGASAWAEALRTVLGRQFYNPVLLIDEAHHLSDAAVEEIRAVFDALPDLGVVFLGSREIRERWSGRRWAQLTSRVFQHIDLDGPMPADVQAICAEAGVEGKRPLDLMRRAASRPGGLRVVRKVLDVAAKLAGGQPIKAEHIAIAYSDRGETAE